MTYLVIIMVALLSVWLGKLSLAGGLTAVTLGALIFLGTGVEGLTYIGIFFVAGVIATVYSRSKIRIRSGEPDLPRTTSQVLANGGLASLLSLCAIFFPEAKDLLVFLIACSLSSAIADTLSSELGVIYGSRHYHSLTFKKDARGADGVISAEGTLIGVGAGLLIALPYQFLFYRDFPFWMVVVAGAAGNYADSVMGALLERKGIIGNNTVNFLNTCTGAAVGYALSMLAK